MIRTSSFRILWPCLLALGIWGEFMLHSAAYVPMTKIWELYVDVFLLKSDESSLMFTVMVLVVPISVSLIYWFMRPEKCSLVCSAVAALVFSGLPGLTWAMISHMG